MDTLNLDAVIRVSRRNGRGEDGEEWSPDRQKDSIERDAERDTFRVAAWFDESDSVSGGDVDRAGLNAALERALSGETDGIVVAKIDRFARTVEGGLAVIRKLHDARKYLYSVKEGMIVGPTKPTAMEKLLRTFFLMLAEWQRDSATEEWESIRRRQIERGINPQETYGYVKGDDRRLTPEPTEAPIVLRVFTERADGVKLTDIADRLNAEGITPRATAKRKAAGWTPGRIASMLSNRVYLGEVRSGDFVNTEAHEPIVTPELFDRANERRETNGRRAGRDYLLTGLLYCAGCGVRMVGNATAKNGDPSTVYLSYRCRRNHPFGKCPDPATVSAPEAEALVMEEFSRRYFGVTLEGVSDTSRFDQLQAADDEASHALSTYPTNPANQRLRMEFPEVYDAGLTALMDAKAATAGALNEERNRALKVEFPEDLETLWPTLSIERQRRYLAAAFDLVAVRRRVNGEEVTDRLRVFLRDSAPAGIIGRSLDALRPITL